MKKIYQLEVQQYHELLHLVRTAVEKIIEDKYEISKCKILHDEDVMALLKISSRTLYNYRTNGLLPYATMGGRYLYVDFLLYMHLIHQTIMQFFKDFTTDTKP